jgi:IS5 family transposase
LRAARALPGNPYDGHTLRDVIDQTQKLTGREIERAYVDKGYRGHDTDNPRRVFISGPIVRAFIVRSALNSAS